MAASDTIECPKCSYVIEVTQALSARMRADLRREVESELEPTRQKLRVDQEKLRADSEALKKRQEDTDTEVERKLESEREKFAERAREQAERKFAVELKDREEALREAKEQVKEANERVLTARKKERELVQLREQLDEERDEIDKKVKEGVEQGRRMIAEQARRQAQEDLAVELKDRDDREIELKEKLKEAEAKELDWRKKERELSDRSEKLDLEVARKIDEERETIREATREQADEQHVLKVKEKDQLIESLNRKIGDLKRRVEQGSQQAQGEAAEVDLEEMLQRAFPFDNIEPIQKGQHGADVLQVVRGAGGLECGRILWESKNAKNWSNKWTGKLREDQRDAKADVAVLTSVTVPDEIKSFDQVDGVWVTSRSFVLPLASVLRAGLIELGQQRRSTEGKHDKMSLLYDYLMGQEFRQRIEAMVDAYNVMGTNLNRERAAMQKLWREREKQIEIARLNVSELFGDLKGIAGRSLESIQALELAGYTERQFLTGESRGEEVAAQVGS